MLPILRRFPVLFVALAQAFLITGCGDPVETEPGKLELSTTSLEFGEIPISTSSSLTFTLSNTGGEPVSLNSITLIEGSLATFDVQWSRATSLDPNASETVTVIFMPSKQQAYSGRIQVRSDAEGADSLLIALTGTGAPSTKDNDGDGYSPATGDCDDGNANAYPGNTEQCDGRDNDCDGAIPKEESDSDGDGKRGCSGDCDDADKNTYTGAPEICDGANKDNNCDGIAADNEDRDGDGYRVCQYDGQIPVQGDCDDSEPKASPGQTEVCGDNIDNNCDGKKDNIDTDGDGFSLCDQLPDCDDLDPNAHPVFVNGSYTGGGNNGTATKPYTSISSALEHLDATCRSVFLYAGTYKVGLTLDDGLPLTFMGASQDSVVLDANDKARHFLVTDESELTLENLTISGGDAQGDGGAVLAQSASLVLDSVTARSNVAAADGGAVAVQSGSLTISNSFFYQNEAGDDGGAVVAVSGSLTDTGSTYQENEGVQGGAMSIQSSRATLDGVSFFSNIAIGSGGGISVIKATGLQLQAGTFWLNTAASNGGGMALDDVSDSSGYIRNCLVQTNLAGATGGGFSFAGTTGIVVSNNTLTENTAAGDGAGVVIRSTSSQSSNLSLISNLIAWSKGPNGLYLEAAGSTIQYNTVYFTSTGINYAGAVSTGSNGNDQVDPLFTSFDDDGQPADDILTLKSGSPSINSGPSDGAWKDPDGSRNDRGAYGGPHALSYP